MQSINELTQKQTRLTISLGKLYGREQELDLLYSTLIRAQCEGEIQVVFVSGSSGSGKSVLVERAFKKNQQCLFGCGKYHERRESKPLSVLRNIIAGICDQMCLSPNYGKYKELLTSKLNAEQIGIMAKLSPRVADIIQAVAMDSSRNVAQDVLDRLKVTLRFFFQAVALEECPVVICVDDLQWAADETLELLGSMLCCSDLQHVVFVACYRDDELNNNDLSTKWIDTIMTKVNTEQIFQLPVPDLTVSNINKLLSHLMNTDEDKTIDLAVLMRNRTNGNAFYLLQLLDYLQVEGLVKKDLSRGLRWSWDLSKIQEKTTLSDNVVQVVTAKINRLPPQVKTSLILAACVNFRVDRNMLTLVKNVDVGGEVISDIGVCLEIATKEGILEKFDDNSVRFAHDKAYEAAFQLIPDENKRALVHFEIGTILWNTFFSKRDYTDVFINLDDVDDRTLFLCVDQLALGIDLIRNADFQVKLAKINLQAAKRSTYLSAFLPAREYLREAISLLKKKGNLWTEHYGLSLEMYSFLAEILNATGQLDAAHEVIDVVLTNAKTVIDKVRVHLTKTHALTAQSRWPEVVETSLDMLDQLGEKMPSEPTKIQQLRTLRSVNGNIRKLSDYEILSLPIMNDKRMIGITSVLENMHFAAFQNGNQKLVTVAISHLVQHTLDFGLSPSSPTGFALMAAQGPKSSKYDVDWCVRLSKLATSLASKLKSAVCKARMAGHLNFVDVLRQPMSLLVDVFFNGYEVLMKYGDMRTAYINMIGYFQFYFYAGLCLKPLLRDLQRFLMQMKEYGQISMLLINTPLYQCVLNLTGNSHNPLDIFHGRAIDLRNSVASENNRAGEQSMWSFLMQIAYYFGDMKLAYEMSKKLQVIDVGQYTTSPFYHCRVFFFALIAIWHAKATGKWAYKWEAMKHSKVVRGWVRAGMINCVHKLQILEAELLSMNRKCKSDRLRGIYNAAIASSARGGFLQDAALANFLAGMHFRSKDRYYSDQCILKAHGAYLAWGAVAISNYIVYKFPNLFDTDATKCGGDSSSFRSRERFQQSLKFQRKTIPSHLRGSTHKLAFSSSGMFGSSQELGFSSSDLFDSSPELGRSSQDLTHI